MTLYSRIKQYLDYGLMVVVVDRFKNKRLFVYVDENDLLLTSAGYLENEKNINVYQEENGWHIHSLLPRPITPYPVGMKVRVDESYLKIEDRYELVEEIETIDYVQVTSQGSFKYRLEESSAWIDHRFLIPVLEEEKVKDALTPKGEWLDIGRKNGWVKEGEVIE